MTLILPAPAKINLHLHVTAIREDGMHELDTAFAYTDLCDLIHIEAADRLEVGCSRAHLAGEGNLVHRLLAAFAEHHGIDMGLRLFIDKHIPEQAGLGGGSSDAATALLAANKLWNVDASIPELIAFATPFGADIPCFLYGRASLARGIGEALQPYEWPLPKQALLLAWPGSGLSTAAVFKRFDADVASGQRSLTLPEALSTMRAVRPDLGANDLEPTASALSSAVKSLLAAMHPDGDPAWMSGSGSSCVALLGSTAAAEALAERLEQSGVASWTHVGRIIATHPLEQLYWDVAKR